MYLRQYKGIIRIYQSYSEAMTASLLISRSLVRTQQGSPYYFFARISIAAAVSASAAVAMTFSASGAQ